MKHLAIILVSVCWFMPISAEPATQPATQKILLLPFVPVEISQADPFISRGIQRSMQADFATIGTVQPITIHDEDPIAAGGYDSANVLRLARAEHAMYVIHGTYQIIETEIRVVGVVIAVQTGQTMGGLKSTANLRDLFDIEDSLSHQAQRLIRAPKMIAANHRTETEAFAKIEKDVPYRNFYAWNYEDPAVTRSRQTLQNRIDYVEPCYGYFAPYSCFGYRSYFGGRYLNYLP